MGLSFVSHTVTCAGQNNHITGGNPKFTGNDGILQTF